MPTLKARAGEFVLWGHAAAVRSCYRGGTIWRTARNLRGIALVRENPPIWPRTAVKRSRARNARQLRSCGGISARTARATLLECDSLWTGL